MKKYFFLLISTFISSIILTELTFATTYVDDTEYWSVEELLELSASYADEVRLHCPRLNFEEEYDYYACIDNYYWDTHIDQETGEWIEETPEEMALSHFKYEGSFAISSVNPSTGEVRAAFQDLPWSFGGAVFDHKWTIDRFYFFWSEGDRDFYKVYKTPESFKNDTALPEDHIIFFGDASHNGENWFISNREIELNTTGPIDLSKVTAYYFYADATNQEEIGPSVSSMFDLDQCVNSPRYSDGMECRLMFSAISGPTYIPFEPDTKLYYRVPYESLYTQNNDDAEQTPETNNEEASLTPTDEPSATDQTHNTESGTDTNLEQAPAIENPEPDPTPDNPEPSSLIIPSAPNTGLSGELVCEKSIEFPWWITLLVALGEILIIWWFIPARKISKILKKGLDKYHIV